VGLSGAFEILSIDTAQKRIGLALLDEGSSRAKTLAEQREQAEPSEDARPDTAPSTSIGSLADNLRNALKGR